MATLTTQTNAKRTRSVSQMNERKVQRLKIHRRYFPHLPVKFYTQSVGVLFPFTLIYPITTTDIRFVYELP